MQGLMFVSVRQAYRTPFTLQLWLDPDRRHVITLPFGTTSIVDQVPDEHPASGWHVLRDGVRKNRESVHSRFFE